MTGDTPALTADSQRTWVERRAADGEAIADSQHRRIVCSRAYYAAFYCLRELAVELLPPKYHRQITRSGSHAVIRYLFPDNCKVFGGCGAAFHTLWATRVDCDYHIEAKFTPSPRELGDAIDHMRVVFEKVRTLNMRDRLGQLLLERALLRFDGVTRSREGTTETRQGSPD